MILKDEAIFCALVFYIKKVEGEFEQKQTADDE